MDSWCYVEPGHTDAMLNSLQQRALRPHDALLIRHEIMKPAIIELLPRHHNNGDIGITTRCSSAGYRSLIFSAEETLSIIDASVRCQRSVKTSNPVREVHSALVTKSFETTGLCE